jgi:hypothetical protein
MRYLLALVALIQISCVTRATSIVLPSGEQGWISYCDATKLKCFKQASKTCPTGYNIMDENQMAQSSASFNGVGGKARSDTRMTMIYTCKAEAAVSH